MNEQLVRDVMAHIRANAELWDQRDFIRTAGTAGGDTCRTTHCFAGWALRLSGFGLVKENFMPPQGWQFPDDAPDWVKTLWRDGSVKYTDFTAQWLLGFSDAQASHVFYALQQTDVEEFAQALEQVTGLSGL